MDNECLAYRLVKTETLSGTGYFDVVPEEKLNFKEAVSLLHHRPMDDFLHKYALAFLSGVSRQELSSLIKRGEKKGDFILLALACEQIFLSWDSLSRANRFFSEDIIEKLAHYSPLIHIRSARQASQRLHLKWIEMFKKNIFNHEPLPSLDHTGFPPVCSGECPVREKKTITITELFPSFSGSPSETQGGSPEKTAENALKALETAKVILETEMRHEASLTPFGLLRKWHFKRQVRNKRHVFSLSGEQISYGRGFTLETARASLLMEIVERYSSFASVDNHCVSGLKHEKPLIFARYSELALEGINAINPNDLALEVRYQDDPLYWIQGTAPPGSRKTKAGPDSHGREDLEILIPLQAVFLFSNLDEISLFSGPGSTGLASGNSLAQAKLSALMEVIERHQASTVPFDPSQCFRLVAGEENPGWFLNACRSMGIEVQFQDITPEWGLPCCSCFVRAQDGRVCRGTAAGLDARQTIVSAMTETNYPFPGGPPSSPEMVNAMVVEYENLPNFSTGSFASDLDLVEQLLLKNGFSPCYVDLTRADLGIPVVRALIPGMEMLGDFDRFSRVHPDLFNHYLRLVRKQ